MSPIVQLFTVALLIEALAQTIMWVIEKEYIRERLIALTISMAICVLGRFDLFSTLGIVFPYGAWGILIGSFFTGILVARGSTYLHDLFTTVQGRAEVARSDIKDLGV